MEFSKFSPNKTISMHLCKRTFELPGTLGSPNWHGKSYRFSYKYRNCLYQDTSLNKPSEAQTVESKQKSLSAKVEKVKKSKEQLERQRAEQIKRTKKIKEALAAHQAVKLKFENAAVKIQKVARGMLVRKRYQLNLGKISRLLTARKIQEMDFQVKTSLATIQKEDSASKVIQKHFRSYLQKKRPEVFKKLSTSNAVTKIQSVVRSYHCKSYVWFLKRRENQLRSILKKLKNIQFRQFWSTIKKHYSKKVLEQSSTPTPSKSILESLMKKSATSPKLN